MVMLFKVASSIWFRCYSTHSNVVNVLGNVYNADEMTNITPKILSRLNKNLHLKPSNPLNHIRKRITHFMQRKFINSKGNPLFSIYNDISPVVTVNENFDSLLIPLDHVSRRKSDNYFINKEYLLRAHTTAHQVLKGIGSGSNILFDSAARNSDCQIVHSLKTVNILRHELQNCLVEMAQTLFGEDVEWKWVDAYFPFTHPSWELEIKINNDWTEMLGCGIIEQEILNNNGAGNRVGWAFGLGLERWAMKLYDIPDIRLFWSTDSGVTSQFEFEDCQTIVKYKPVSSFPQCCNDISFWLPDDGSFSSNDFYDLVHSIGGALVEQVKLIDEFQHPKTNGQSHCYRITYRHMTRTLTQEEVNVVHCKIEKLAAETLNVAIR